MRPKVRHLRLTHDVAHTGFDITHTARHATQIRHCDTPHRRAVPRPTSIWWRKGEGAFEVPRKHPFEAMNTLATRATISTENKADPTKTIDSGAGRRK